MDGFKDTEHLIYRLYFIVFIMIYLSGLYFFYLITTPVSPFPQSSLEENTSMWHYES